MLPHLKNSSGLLLLSRFQWLAYSLSTSNLPELAVGHTGSHGNTEWYLVQDFLNRWVDASPRFAGASAISTTPTIANTTTPASSRRSITFRYSCAAITPACARFAHPAKAIRLRFAAGSRPASSKQIPSGT